MEKTNQKFNFESFTYKLLAILFAVAIFYVVFINFTQYDDKKDFLAVSKKPDNITSDKDDAITSAHKTISDVVISNDALIPTNLNIAKMYGDVVDRDATSFYSAYVPIPVMSDEDMKNEIPYENNIAYQIFGKLQVRYNLFYQMLCNLYSLKPEEIVERYGYDMSSIIGKYNPDVPYHMPHYNNTYKIQNFQNINIHCFDGDGNEMFDSNNIKDIMSMASVYTYYHDPYDYNKYLDYAYYLFDNSYIYVATISDIYYCSGCVHFDTNNEEIETLYEKEIPTFEKMSRELHTQKRLPRELPYKSGRLVRLDDDSYNVKHGDYATYLEAIEEGQQSLYYNYCPGHIDLDVNVKIMTFDAANSLMSIDERYGNVTNTMYPLWNGWDAEKINDVRTLYNKDWNKEYGIDITYDNQTIPLTREEINYFLNRLDENLSVNRRKVIETALKSVGRIPYYYGGKSYTLGYEGANFGRKVLPDYKGRCLKGLDCSGWVNWVYNSTFRTNLVTADGTQKLASVGNKIRREELKPGDLIVRPGHDSHVMMFLEWAPDGRVTVIHENGTANNVSIGTYDAYYPYYRSIFDI